MSSGIDGGCPFAFPYRLGDAYRTRLFRDHAEGITCCSERPGSRSFRRRTRVLGTRRRASVSNSETRRNLAGGRFPGSSTSGRRRGAGPSGRHAPHSHRGGVNGPHPAPSAKMSRGQRLMTRRSRNRAAANCGAVDDRRRPPLSLRMRPCVQLVGRAVGRHDDQTPERSPAR